MLDRTGRPCYNTSCSAGLAHLVERHLAKVEVASSSLVARSRKDHSSIWMSDLFYCLVCKLGLAASTATRGACFLNHRGPAGFLQIAAGGLRDAGCGFEPRSPLHTKQDIQLGCPAFFIRRRTRCLHLPRGAQFCRGQRSFACLRTGNVVEWEAENQKEDSFDV